MCGVDINAKVKLWQGDITALQVDVVVNAANGGMWAGGGICGAIHKAAGSALEKESVGYVQQHGDVPTGQTLVTAAHGLRARHVFHTVGPRDGNAAMLRSCYQSCLDLLLHHHCRSIALPCVATGIFGFDNRHAALIALMTTRDWLEDAEHRAAVDAVLFCVFNDKDLHIYQAFMPLIFPLPSVFLTTAGTSSESHQPTPHNETPPGDDTSHRAITQSDEGSDANEGEKRVESVPEPTAKEESEPAAALTEDAQQPEQGEDSGMGSSQAAEHVP